VVSSGINAQTVPFFLLAVPILLGAFTGAPVLARELFTWYFSPFFAEGQTARFPMQLFGNLGVDFAAWTLLAFSAAAFLGVVIRRTVAAMAVALAGCTVLDVATMMAIRQHYATPLVASGSNPPGGGSAWMMGQWVAGPDGTQWWSYIHRGPAGRTRPAS
jgi:hypothetical protein